MIRAWICAAVLVIVQFAWGDEPPKVIAVSGSASVFVTPDIADLRAGVTTEGVTSAEAKASADKTAAAILEAIRRVGIPDADVQTAQVTAELHNPRNQFEQEQKKGPFFSATREFLITIRDIRKAGAVFDAVAAAGANTIHGPDFRSSQDRKYRDQARRMAVRAGREKAELLASEAGVKVGQVREIREVPEWVPDPTSNSSSRMPAGSLVGEEDMGTRVPPGQIEIQTQISIVYELKR